MRIRDEKGDNMKNNIIIGTAGHIDHGKTTLVKALSGIETDTTKEEKERGLSINLGFAYFDLPNGKRCGIVDVPGHEKFIKNMLAGVSGINLVLLLIDAKEGIMPQTKEHVDILSLLGINNCIVVITKIDLVDKEYLELVREDVEDYISNTSLSGSKIIEVDSISRKGIEKLLEEIEKETSYIEQKNINKDARLNIDRVFQIKGFGTVVTGTLIEGQVNVGDELELYPSGLRVKVRNIQVHEKDVNTAYAGQRTAINLANIKLSDVKRGDSLAKEGSLIITNVIDVEIKLISHIKYSLELWDRIRFYTGTIEVMARVVPLGTDKIASGEKGFVQLRLEEEIAIKNQDKFIIRTYSPMETIGGGIILDSKPIKHTRFNEEVLLRLTSQLSGNLEQLILNNLLLSDSFIVSINEIKKELGCQIEELNSAINELERDKAIIKTPMGYIHEKKYNEILEDVKKILADYHTKYKLRAGMPRIELVSKFKIVKKDLNVLLDIFVNNGSIQSTNNIISNNNFKVEYNSQQSKEKVSIEKILLESGYTPPSKKELINNSKVRKEVLESLIGTKVINLDEDLVIHNNYYKEAANKVREHFITNDKLTLAEFRDMTGSSRKYSMAILESLDRDKVTRRVENYRVLIK